MRVVVLILDRVFLNCKTFRIIPSSFPPIKLFESCVLASDLEDLYELEALTNDRLQDDVGELTRVAAQDRISGAGTSVIMASFTHLGMPSRFTDGGFGVYYAGLEIDTAIAETMYWQAKQMQESNEPPFERTMRVYVANVDASVGAFVDLTEDKLAQDPDSYAYSQVKSKELRNNGEYGLYYRSVRHLGGHCIAAFKPKIVLPAVQSKHLRYCWNGKEIFKVYEIKELTI